ncbi:MAG: FtsX-like permease family protein, partial [Alphaproteobacteria bacterium]|nr:FtsX-like permease family protein [Alphaproteobacteria bacterium]
SVCIIGETIRREIFPGAAALGQRLRVGAFSCEVVGVLPARGQSAFGNDQDAAVVLPLRTFHRRVAGSNRISSINISVAEALRMREVQAEAEQILRELRRIGPGEDDNFTIRDMTQMASTLASTTAVMTGLLGAVAAVSLLVGGIGIMNIMLVSVTERTKEIGIRLAVGALERQVLLQFLVEAAVLSLIGGIIGVALGLGLAALASALMAVPFAPSPAIALMALGISGAIGLAFGYFPARRAARLDPIEALRHE